MSAQPVIYDPPLSARLASGTHYTHGCETPPSGCDLPAGCQCQNGRLNTQCETGWCAAQKDTVNTNPQADVNSGPWYQLSLDEVGTIAGVVIGDRKEYEQYTWTA